MRPIGDYSSRGASLRQSPSLSMFKVDLRVGDGKEIRESV